MNEKLWAVGESSGIVIAVPQPDLGMFPHKLTVLDRDSRTPYADPH